MSTLHTLPAEMTVHAAAAVRTVFLEWLRKLPKGKRAAALAGQPLIVDATAVMEIDASGLQLLVALSRSLASKNRPLHLTAPSQTLSTACATLGLGRLLLSDDESTR